MAVMKYELCGEIGIVTIDSPPVNALSQAVRQGLKEGFEQGFADSGAKAFILICNGRTFFAGADISEFGKPPQEPGLGPVLIAIENSNKPVIAAIHGTALGGGLELALHCNYRVAVPSAQMGLPEVNLGLLPGAGGTQRLPRIVGIPSALDLITSGEAIKANAALEVGVIDFVTEEGKLREGAIIFAQKLIDDNAPLLRVRDRSDKVSEYKGNTEIFANFRADNARSFRGFKAPESIIKCIEASANLPFEEGIEVERTLFQELLVSPESAAQRHVFFAQRETSKIPDLPKDTATRAIKTAGVIGAGTMGGGITMNYLNAGIPVVLVEQNEEALNRGLGVIRKNYENSAKRGRITQENVEQLMAMITPSISYDALAKCDIVTEAVFELMSIKKEVFEKLDKVAKPGAILASNTSFLDIDEIASATSRPQDVIGHHYFSPANVMPLLEIVRGKQTSNEVLATSLAIAKTIKKTLVVARVCPGFIANRIMRKRGEQSEAIALEGTSFEKIDKVQFDYGFAMGNFQMSDLVGLDVIGRDSNEKTVRSELVAQDRLGQKKNGGFYDWDENRKPTISQIAVELFKEIAAEKGIKQKSSNSEEILSRLLYPIVNEGAHILAEKVAIRPSDIDIACIKGYNWPVYTGGPMHWADHIGLDKIVARLRELEAEYGEYFKPSELLVQLAADGKGFASLN